jgi:tetratricopeptide (TPR) repeat protein
VAGGSNAWIPFGTIGLRAWAVAESGNLDLGISELRRVLEWKRGWEGEPGVHFHVLVQTAAALRQRGDLREASVMLPAAEGIAASMGRDRYRNWAREERLRLSIARNDRPAMEQALRQFDASPAGEENPSMESLREFVLMAEVRLALGDASKALAMAQQAIALLEADPARAWRREQEFQAARTAGMAQLSLGRPSEARDLLQRALDASAGRLDPQVSPRVAELLELQARAEAAIGDRARADTLLARARSIRARRS